MRPLVLDLDRSVAALPDELRLDLSQCEQALRFGCRVATLDRFAAGLDAGLVRQAGVVFLGSGDFHHLTLPLVRFFSEHAALEVVVFDNHPDNMRYVFGVHCGSWVRRVAHLPFVSHVHVVGITSTDVCGRRLAANYLGPLRAGKLTYWCIGVESRWARLLGRAGALRTFDSVAGMIQRFTEMQSASRAPVYVSIDKDVLAPAEVRTNWDQGLLTERELVAALAALRERVVGADVTGDVSLVSYASRWKRWLSVLDAQPPVHWPDLSKWQERHGALNRRLVPLLAGLMP